MRATALTLAALIGMAGPSAAGWKIDTKTSNVDDSTTVTASVFADADALDRFGNPKKPYLVLRCMENSTDLFIGIGDMFMADSGGFGEVTMRIDKAKAFTMSMTASTGHEVLGLWDGAGVNLARSMIGSDRLLAVVTPFNEAPRELVFSLKGYDSVAEKVGRACHWW